MAFNNLGPQDAQLLLQPVLPASNTNATTGILDLQAIAPSSDAWRLGRIAVQWPSLPENTGTGITIALQAAPPSLTNSKPAPQLPVPGAFVTPTTSQTLTIPAVAIGGSPAGVGYFTLAFDANGSVYQFYQFVITTPNGTNTTGETITIAWMNA